MNQGIINYGRGVRGPLDKCFLFLLKWSLIFKLMAHLYTGRYIAKLLKLYYNGMILGIMAPCLK
jgi:hypothetical protein